MLVVGGSGTDREHQGAELWDPATGEFTPAGSLTEPRAHHTATSCLTVACSSPEGRSPSEPVAVEVWDPATNGFSVVGSTA